MRLRLSHAVAAVLVLGSAVEIQAAQRRGHPQRGYGNSMPRVPAKPAIIDSTPTIETLNKALKALGSTDRDYDGHREKAVEHVASAIHHLERAQDHGKSNAAIEKAAAGHAASATKTAATPEAASDESLHKAKAILFAIHHDLVEHTASRGHIRADADVRIAIDEIAHALNPKPPSAATPAALTTTSAKPAK